MSTINKPWSYDVSEETCVGFIGSDLWFTAKTTGGDSSDSLIVSLPTDAASLEMLEQFIAAQRAK